MKGRLSLRSTRAVDYGRPRIAGRCEALRRLSALGAASWGYGGDPHGCASCGDVWHVNAVMLRKRGCPVVTNSLGMVAVGGLPNCNADKPNTKRSFGSSSGGMGHGKRGCPVVTNSLGMVAVGGPSIWAVGCVPISKRIAKKGVFMKRALYRRLASFAVPVAAAAASASAFAVDPATGVEAITAVATGATGYGPVMFGLSVVSVGILIGVKWIKRARGAA